MSLRIADVSAALLSSDGRVAMVQAEALSKTVKAEGFNRFVAANGSRAHRDKSFPSCFLPLIESLLRLLEAAAGGTSATVTGGNGGSSISVEYTLPLARHAAEILLTLLRASKAFARYCSGVPRLLHCHCRLLRACMSGTSGMGGMQLGSPSFERDPDLALRLIKCLTMMVEAEKKAATILRLEGGIKLLMQSLAYSGIGSGGGSGASTSGFARPTASSMASTGSSASLSDSMGALLISPITPPPPSTTVHWTNAHKLLRVLLELLLIVIKRNEGHSTALLNQVLPHLGSLLSILRIVTHQHSLPKLTIPALTILERLCKEKKICLALMGSMQSNAAVAAMAAANNNNNAAATPNTDTSATSATTSSSAPPSAAVIIAGAIAASNTPAVLSLLSSLGCQNFMHWCLQQMCTAKSDVLNILLRVVSHCIETRVGFGLLMACGGLDTLLPLLRNQLHKTPTVRAACQLVWLAHKQQYGALAKTAEMAALYRFDHAGDRAIFTKDGQVMLEEEWIRRKAEKKEMKMKQKEQASNLQQEMATATGAEDNMVGDDEDDVDGESACVAGGDVAESTTPMQAEPSVMEVPSSTPTDALPSSTPPIEPDHLSEHVDDTLQPAAAADMTAATSASAPPPPPPAPALPSNLQPNGLESSPPSLDALPSYESVTSTSLSSLEPESDAAAALHAHNQSDEAAHNDDANSDVDGNDDELSPDERSAPASDDEGAAEDAGESDAESVASEDSDGSNAGSNKKKQKPASKKGTAVRKGSMDGTNVVPFSALAPTPPLTPAEIEKVKQLLSQVASAAIAESAAPANLEQTEQMGDHAETNNDLVQPSAPMSNKIGCSVEEAEFAWSMSPELWDPDDPETIRRTESNQAEVASAQYATARSLHPFVTSLPFPSFVDERTGQGVPGMPPPPRPEPMVEPNPIIILEKMIEATKRFVQPHTFDPKVVFDRDAGGSLVQLPPPSMPTSIPSTATSTPLDSTRALDVITPSPAVSPSPSPSSAPVFLAAPSRMSPSGSPSASPRHPPQRRLASSSSPAPAPTPISSPPMAMGRIGARNGTAIDGNKKPTSQPRVATSMRSASTLTAERLNARGNAAATRSTITAPSASVPPVAFGRRRATAPPIRLATKASMPAAARSTSSVTSARSGSNTSLSPMISPPSTLFSSPSPTPSPTSPPLAAFPPAASPSASPPVTSVPPLVFESRFESGNLHRAIQTAPGSSEYDLVLSTDVNSRGHTQWFCFRIQGAMPGVKYKFNILNLEKSKSTFNTGMKPVWWSQKATELAASGAAMLNSGGSVTGSGTAATLSSMVSAGWQRAPIEECAYFHSYHPRPYSDAASRSKQSHTKEIDEDDDGEEEGANEKEEEDNQQQGADGDEEEAQADVDVTAVGDQGPASKPKKKSVKTATGAKRAVKKVKPKSAGARPNRPVMIAPKAASDIATATPSSSSTSSTRPPSSHAASPPSSSSRSSLSTRLPLVVRAVSDPLHAPDSEATGEADHDHDTLVGSSQIMLPSAPASMSSSPLPSTRRVVMAEGEVESDLNVRTNDYLPVSSVAATAPSSARSTLTSPSRVSRPRSAAPALASPNAVNKSKTHDDTPVNAREADAADASSTRAAPTGDERFSSDNSIPPAAADAGASNVHESSDSTDASTSVGASRRGGVLVELDASPAVAPKRRVLKKKAAAGSKPAKSAKTKVHGGKEEDEVAGSSTNTESNSAPKKGKKKVARKVKKVKKVKQKGGGCFYTLTFTLRFPHADDTVFLAYHYPFTYSFQRHCLDWLQQSSSLAAACMRRQRLTQSRAGNCVELLTITDMPRSKVEIESVRKRKLVVISARIHPGESNASWVLKGLLEFLLSSHDAAAWLRRNIVFKIVPMLNIDGVVEGNYRTSLIGVDLNRNWDQPSSVMHPSIYYTKKLLLCLSVSRSLLLYCDFHGHSAMRNMCLYGCDASRADSSANTQLEFLHRQTQFKHVQDALTINSPTTPTFARSAFMTQLMESDGSASMGMFAAAASRRSQPSSAYGRGAGGLSAAIATHLASATCNPLADSPFLNLAPNARAILAAPLLLEQHAALAFPELLSRRIGNRYFSLPSCSFSVRSSKSGTGRVVFWRLLRCPDVFTFEASFAGASTGELKGCHFTTKDYEQAGAAFAETIKELVRVRKEKYNAVCAQAANENARFNLAMASGNTPTVLSSIGTAIISGGSSSPLQPW